jgi:polyisoprenoid-binding protein YceI
MTTRCFATALVFAALQATSASLGSAAVPPSLREYRVDFGHSIVEFSIGFALSRVKGRFTSGNGTILYDEAHPERSSVTMVIEAKSIDTGWPHRDEHLRTADFFDVEKFPTITFQSARLLRAGEAWTMQGKLTMHGVTKDVAMRLRVPRAPSRSPESGWMVLNADATTRLARADFGIRGGSASNSWFNAARQATMADSVDVSLEIEAYSPDAASHRIGRVQQYLDSTRTAGVQSLVDRIAELKRTRPAAEAGNVLSGGDLVARGMLTTGRVADAVALSRALTQLFPEGTRAWAVHGLALAMSGDARGAAVQYARMKEVFRPAAVDPKEKFPQVDDNWWYLDQLVRTALELELPQHAVPLARAIAGMYPEIARAHTTLGVALATAGNDSAAAGSFAEALAKDPGETGALEWRRRIAGR